MRNKAARLLKVQAKISGLSYKRLKKLWNSPTVSHKLKGKWRRIVERQAKEASANPNT